MKTKVAIHGCGRIAGRSDRPLAKGPIATHAQAYYRMKQVALVAVSDRSHERAKVFAGMWEVPDYYGSLDELLSESQPDVLSVCSRNEEHVSDLLQCLAHPQCPSVILVEKPLCMSTEEAKEIEVAAQLVDTVLIVNHSRRFDPSHQDIQKAIASNTFGDFLGGNAWYYGGWLNNGSHLVDTLNMMLGENESWDSVKIGHPGRDNDPCLDLTMKYLGADVSIQSVDERNFQLFEYELRFEKARIRFEDFGTRIQIERVMTNDIDERVLIPNESGPISALTDPLFYAAEHAVEQFRFGKGVDAEKSSADLEYGLIATLQTMNTLWSIKASTEH